ncbi:MAG: hypothetical protein IPJ20_09375 [Flammeovirgaceae bacterium]|nr:hypothetical protein [Flammeovirgaceae bacterium]
MLRNYLKIAIRNLRQKFSLFLYQYLGLSIGIASSVLILLWVADEYFDM